MIRALDLTTMQTTFSATTEYSRILSAAVINAQFRRKLLSDPLAAVSGGYSDETFDLNEKEQHQLAGITATSLADFAAQLA